MVNKTKEPNVTLRGLKVLSVFVDAGGQMLSGADIMRSTGAMSGTLYPILARYEEAGWLHSEWENVDPAEAGRPRRRLYQITATGKRIVAREKAVLNTPLIGAPKWAS
jgi:DNA-binding PadR family transcriptional regulator